MGEGRTLGWGDLVRQAESVDIQGLAVRSDPELAAHYKAGDWVVISAAPGFRLTIVSNGGVFRVPDWMREEQGELHWCRPGTPDLRSDRGMWGAVGKPTHQTMIVKDEEWVFLLAKGGSP